MPLLEKSPNICDVTGNNVHKRSHEQYAADVIKLEGNEGDKPQTTDIHPVGPQSLPHPVLNGNLPSPQGSPTLTEAGSSTPNRTSPSPLTPSKPCFNPKEQARVPSTHSPPKPTTAQPPAAKKVKLTAAEREAKLKAAEEKKKLQEEQRKQKAEEKAAAAKDREEKKKQRDDEKEEKRKQKEEEVRKKEEEKEKKERSQMRLGNFFPKKKVEAIKDEDGDEKDATPSPAKSQESPYRRRFQPFFVKENTSWTKSIINMDYETQSVKTRILDEAIDGKRAADVQPGSFDAVKLFALPVQSPKRGRLHHPVKHIMEAAYRDAERATNQGADAALIMKEAKSKLSKVPLKIIAFSQDVRPPYYGTVTFKPFVLGKDLMRKLARQSTGRTLPLDYDYDSEAEWQDGDEEGEDLDGDDDEEELDDEDDMDEFLDDSEDAGLARGVFGGNAEPVSTGLYFENEGRTTTNRVIYDHRLEIMHEGIEHGASIDPYSQGYWCHEPKKGPKKGTNGDTAGNMMPPTTPSNAFTVMNNGTSALSGEMKLVKSDVMDELKQLVLDNKEITKLGLVDLVHAKLRSIASKMEVKNTIEHVAERVGAGRQKAWALKVGHEISS